MNYDKILLLIITSLLSISLAQDNLTFPNLTGKTLDDVELNFPQDFSRDYTLVLLPLEQNHQQDFSSWESYVQELEQSRDNVSFYQVLPIGKLNFFVRGIISSAMKAEYNDVTQARTLPLFLEPEPILASLTISNTSDMHVLLVKGQTIIWRTTGVWTDAKAQELETAMQGTKLPTDYKGGL